MISIHDTALSIKEAKKLSRLENYMDTLQIQISELRDKIDRLHELIEDIGNQVKILNTQQIKRVEQESYTLPNFAANNSNIISQEGDSEYQLTHKDILVDDNSSSSTANSSSENLAPDTQIRRLTAQLTAAYNRIAALEEQLLTYRIHS
ncbi:MAG: hypothetical protein AAFQ80_08290 [Cyanobacteria bacterium J06621_8]